MSLDYALTSRHRRGDGMIRLFRTTASTSSNPTGRLGMIDSAMSHCLWYLARATEKNSTSVAEHIRHMHKLIPVEIRSYIFDTCWNKLFGAIQVLYKCNVNGPFILRTTPIYYDITFIEFPWFGLCTIIGNVWLVQFSVISATFFLGRKVRLTCTICSYVKFLSLIDKGSFKCYIIL